MTEHLHEEGHSDDPGEEQNLKENVVEEQSTAEPAAGEPVGAASEGLAEPAGSVNLDEAEQQVAEWRHEDESLLGEAPEVAPVPTADAVTLPASTSEAEAEVATLRQEDEALLGEALETTPAPAAEES
jgi:hypothetical protein